MPFKRLLLLLRLSLYAGRKRNCIYLFLYFLSAVFVILFVSYSAKLFYSMNLEIDKSPAFSKYAEVTVACGDEQLKALSETVNIHGVITKAEAQGVYIIKMESINEANKLIRQLEGETACTLILDDSIRQEIEFFELIKKGLIFCAVLATGGILLIFNLNIKQALDECRYDIAIYYAVGYTPKQIVIIIWMETVVLLSLGILAAALFSLIIEPVIQDRVLETGGKMLLSAGSGLGCPAVLILVPVVAILFIEIYNVKKYLNKQDFLTILRG